MPRIKTIEQLERELAAQKKQVAGLLVRRAKLLARLAKLDKAIAALTGTNTVLAVATKGKPWRQTGKDGKSLPQCIHDVLAAAGKPMRAKAVKQAVLDAGYKTASKKGFYGMVAAALRDKKRFARVTRGVYKLA